MVFVTTILGTRKLGFWEAVGFGLTITETSLITLSSSENGSPCIDERSEQLWREWERERGGRSIGPRDWQVLGGRGGGGGEFDGVEVWGFLEGVRAITDALSWSATISSLSSLTDSWWVSRGINSLRGWTSSEVCSSLWESSLRVSLQRRPSALERSLADKSSWKLDPLDLLLALGSCREPLPPLYKAPLSFQLTLLSKGEGGGARWRILNFLASGFLSATRYFS